MSLRPMLCICIPALALALACPAQKTAGPEPGEARDSTAAARVAGETITVAEVDEWIKEQMFRQATGDREATKLHEIRSRALNEMINERLLEQQATSVGVTPEELLRQETEKQSAVGDEELLAFYEQNQERMGEVEFEEVKPRIRRHLQQQRGSAAEEQYLAALRTGASVEILLAAPRVEVEPSGPSLGPDQAPVTVVEFSDYRCGFCKRAQSVVQALLERYPSEVRFVHRHFPLNPTSREAAEAALCAKEQGRFWEFHRMLFASNAKLDTEGLRQHASEAELNLEAFQVCLDEHRFEAVVDADLAAGRAAGVRGTPAFFVNGIPLKGARPLEDFVAVIEKELGQGES